MRFLVHVDWKFVAALGLAVTGVVLATKIDASAAERVLTLAVETRGEYAIVGNGGC